MLRWMRMKEWWNRIPFSIYWLPFILWPIKPKWKPVGVKMVPLWCDWEWEEWISFPGFDGVRRPVRIVYPDEHGNFS